MHATKSDDSIRGFQGIDDKNENQKVPYIKENMEMFQIGPFYSTI